MLQELGRHWRLLRKDYLTGLLLSVGLAALADIVLALVAHFARAAVPGVGFITFCVAAGLYTVILLTGNVGVYLNLALKTGATRRGYVAACAVLNLLYALALMLLARLWFVLEDRVFGLNTLGLRPPTLLTFAALALGVVVVGLWGGALMMRYGRAGFWVMWALWMVASLMVSQLGALLDTERTEPIARALQAVAAVMAGLPFAGWWLLAGLLALAAAAHTWLMLRRVQAYD